MRTKLINALLAAFALDESAILNVDDVSATISKEMQRTAVVAVTMACLAMLLYVSVRFKNIRMGASAIIALLHDVIFVSLAYAVLRIPLNYSFIAVVLTILGFSINATIVIFDRVRENKDLLKRPTNQELMNVSINQTIRRCIYSSLTVLITTACLYILGVQSIKDFTLPIMVGVIVGTYSSICVAGSVWYMFTIGVKKSFQKDAATE